MNFREREVKLVYIQEAILCIAFGIAIGLGIYGIFLYFNIAVFGWNLGLIFAPLIAGYGETYLAHKLIGEDIGAISAFILFAYTTFYSFILKNPTLGVNITTIGSIAVILQAAFPTLINYIILVVVFGIISYILGIFKRITTYIYNKIKYTYYKYIIKQPHLIEIKTVTHFNENESNQTINNLDFIFITSTDILDKKIINLGQFYATTIIKKDTHLVNTNPEKTEQEILNKLKKGKDDSLIKLANNIKQSGGNGVVNLEIKYGLIGIGGDHFQIITMGTGIYLEE